MGHNIVPATGFLTLLRCGYGLWVKEEVTERGKAEQGSKAEVSISQHAPVLEFMVSGLDGLCKLITSRANQIQSWAENETEPVPLGRTDSLQ